MDCTKRWLDRMGEIFLIDIGIEQNHHVIDFGCGIGNYTIPAAKVVGEKGRVYAVDKNKESLYKLMQRSEKMELKNIEIIDVSERIKMSFQDKSIDAVLLYDVIHLVDNRRKLLTEMHQILKTNALISIYPKHHQEHMNMELDDVREEIKSAGFGFERMLYKILIHDNHLEQGYVLNFRKR